MHTEEFVANLYQALMDQRKHGAIPVQFADADVPMPDVSSSKPWQWTVLGDPVFWFLQIRDERAPTYGHPYQLEAGRNFFPWAQQLGMATPERTNEFLQVLVHAMDAQELGQYEAADDPEWAQRREFLNPWASRKEEPATLPPTPDERDIFMKELFDVLTARKQSRQFPWDAKGELPSNDHIHPHHPRIQDHWRWTLKGHRDHWWLEIVDPRYPGPNYPYRLDLSKDQSLSRLASHGCDTVFQVLTTRMEEGLLGQSEAQQAYDAGANPSNPPWVHS